MCLGWTWWTTLDRLSSCDLKTSSTCTKASSSLVKSSFYTYKMCPCLLRASYSCAKSSFCLLIKPFSEWRLSFSLLAANKFSSIAISFPSLSLHLCVKSELRPSVNFKSLSELKFSFAQRSFSRFKWATSLAIFAFYSRTRWSSRSVSSSSRYFTFKSCDLCSIILIRSSTWGYVLANSCERILNFSFCLFASKDLQSLVSFKR